MHLKHILTTLVFLLLILKYVLILDKHFYWNDIDAHFLTQNTKEKKFDSYSRLTRHAVTSPTNISGMKAAKHQNATFCATATLLASEKPE